MKPDAERRFAVKTSDPNLNMSWIQSDGESMPPEDCHIVFMVWRTEYGAFVMQFTRTIRPDGSIAWTTDHDTAD